MSRIEQLIGEIEEYIDSCKFQPLQLRRNGTLSCSHKANQENIAARLLCLRCFHKFLQTVTQFRAL